MTLSYKKNKKIIFLAIFLSIILLLSFFSINYLFSADSCNNNICKGSISVGGDNIFYYYTKYLSPNGELKIRFVSSAKNGYVSYAIAGLPVQPQVDILSSPFAGDKSKLKDITITQTNNIIFESIPRMVDEGAIDFVAKIFPTGISDGNHDISLFLVQNNANGQVDFSFNVGENYPLNDNEVMNFDSINNTCSDYPSADPLLGDNDLDYYADCRDSDCDDLYASHVLDSDVYCRYENEISVVGQENNCYDRFDNDFDKDGNSGWDYNRKTGIDCRDLDCEDQQGDPDNADNLCWYNDSNEQGEGEAKGYPWSCRDEFNNDIDNGSGVFAGIDHYDTDDYLDCVDTNCWRMGGSSDDIDDHPCPAKESNDSAWCADDFDNDYDDGVNSLDKNPNSGLDCKDYDCRLIELGSGDYYNSDDGKTYACPYNEQINADGDKDPSLCFDGVDNDLDYYQWDGNQYVFNPDGGIDCADLDCIGAKDPVTGQVCYPNEFEIGLYQVCGDGIDNDGDDPDDNYIHEQTPIGGFDCEDDRHEDGNAQDCWQMFGNCGPCPDVENITYSSCADSLDNDLDNNFDCSDSDCSGKIGSLINATFCALVGGEIGDLCFDNFDNDASGEIDCADSSCFGSSKSMPYGLTKECGVENIISLCSDTFDNDRDGKRDCLDQNCSGVGSCADSWTEISCKNFPNTNSQSITSTISAAVDRNIHINTVHHFEISGSASNYNYLLIMVGSILEADENYPYELSNAKCTFDLPPNVIFIEDSSSAYHYGKFQNIGPVESFTIKVDCQAPSIPKGPDNFMIDVLMNSEAGPENGNKIFTVQTFENTIPVVSEIEVGGMDNDFSSVTVPYGGSIDFRGVPNDPDIGFGSSGICSCTASVMGYRTNDINFTDQVTDSNCQTTINNLKEDTEFCVSVRATDGAGNTGANYVSGGGEFCHEEGSFPWYIDVTPIVSGDIELERRDSEGNYYKDSAGIELTNFVSPFYKSEDILIFNNVGFRTADNGSFPASANGPDNKCQLKITNESGTLVYSGIAEKDGDSNTTICSGQYSIEDDLGLSADGTYFINVSVTDNEGYTIESNRKVFYICNSDPLSYPDGHVCQLADFDQDGAVEGIHAKESLYGNPGLVCDNCPDLFNPDQTDLNANGIGDVCEPNGLCVLNSNPCVTDQDCEINACVDNICSIAGGTCNENSACLPNYCDNGIGRCSDLTGMNPGCVFGLCILDGQCSCDSDIQECNSENCTCIDEHGYCEHSPEEICFVDEDCRERCIEGICEFSGFGCSTAEDCWPTCDFIEEVGSFCSDTGLPCANSQDCWDICITIEGDDEDVNDDGEVDKGVCVVSGDECESDADCPDNICADAQCNLSGDVCGDELQCPVNYCDLRYGRCSDDPSVVCLIDEECGYPLAYCEKDIGIKLIYDEEGNVIGWEYCYVGEDCDKTWGICDETGLICTDDIQCPGEDKLCGELGYPWLETQFGGIYTRGQAKALFKPPTGYYNATYCIRAQGGIENLTSAAGCLESEGEQPFNYPQSVNRFTNIIGKIDLEGIESGQYGTVVSDGPITDNFSLDNKVYIYYGDLTLNDINIKNNSGTGLVVVYGDLNIKGNITYFNDLPESDISQLASMGWIILDNPNTSGIIEGNVKISPSVNEIVGSFYVEGKVSTGAGFNPLTVRGLMLAQEFKFERLFASMTRGAERIIYDGRAQANPPPGMADLTKSLPIVRTGR